MLIGIDANVLIDEELGDASVKEALATIRRKIPRAQLVVPEIVVGELAKLFELGHQGAEMTLKNLVIRGYTPLVPTGTIRSYILSTGDKIRAAGLVPEKEKNDSYIIAECAHQGCAILLSSDHHCLNAHNDAADLWRLLAEDHAQNDHLIVAKPAVIARKFG